MCNDVSYNDDGSPLRKVCIEAKSDCQTLCDGRVAAAITTFRKARCSETPKRPGHEDHAPTDPARCSFGLRTGHRRANCRTDHEQEGHAIGVDAYVYFYSLMSMDITRKQFTHVEPGREFGKGPMNMFVNVPEYPPGDFKRSCARISTRSIPSHGWILTGSRWSSPRRTPPAGSISCRCLTCGRMSSHRLARAGNFLVTPPGWAGAVPQGMTRLVAPTS